MVSLAYLQQLKGEYITESPSKAGNWLGFKLHSISKGEAALSLLVRPEMCNPYGMIHGGMMSLLIDETIGWSIISLESELNYTSLNLVVDFLYGAPQGEEITAHSKVVRQGKKVVNCEVHVYDSKKNLLAKASSNLISTNLRRTTDGQ